MFMCCPYFTRNVLLYINSYFRQSHAVFVSVVDSAVRKLFISIHPPLQSLLCVLCEVCESVEVGGEQKLSCKSSHDRSVVKWAFRSLSFRLLNGDIPTLALNHVVQSVLA